MYNFNLRNICDVMKCVIFIFEKSSELTIQNKVFYTKKNENDIYSVLRRQLTINTNRIMFISLDVEDNNYLCRFNYSA